jgi:hypothetical protein
MEDLNKIPEIYAIIHLAGKAHDTKNQTNAQVYFDINTGLTEKIYVISEQLSVISYQ